MNSNHQIGTFAIPVYQDVDYRFIRLRQTGKNANGFHQLVITSFEPFCSMNEFFSGNKRQYAILN
jgi:hypothetical protein